jgi:hypothetical protein
MGMGNGEGRKGLAIWGNGPVLSPVSRAAAAIIEQLGRKNQKFALALIKSIKQFEENEERQG